MADSHPSDEGNEAVRESTEAEQDADSQPENSSRRTFMKSVGAAAAMAGAGSLVGEASAADLDTYLNQSGEVHIPAGEYSWDGSDLSIGSNEAIIGDGNPGDVVWNLESGTMYGQIRGRLENITVRGANPDPQSGLRIYPGCTLDGFLWPEGGQEDRDMAIFTSEGGDDRVHIRNSGWAWMVNNGAYVDKPPVTMENCVAVNNNISGIRVGHRHGTSSGKTTYIRNCLIAVTRNVPNDSTNSSNARGVRVRAPGNFVIENCWFVYLDVDKGGDLVVFHDEAAGSNVTIRDCAFYNNSGGDLVRDKTGGDVDLTIENCTVEGSGNRNVDISYSGSGFTESSAEYPLPSQITGLAAADEIEGVGPGIGPWTEDGSTVTSPSGHTIVIHASPDNSGSADVSFTVDGSISYDSEAESGTDIIVTNDDGTVTATSVDLNPDALDSYRYDGNVVDYNVPDGTVVDISVDGTTTSFAELVGDDSSSDDGSTDDGTSGDGSTDDGSTDDGSTDDGSTGTGTREILLHADPNNEYDVDLTFTVDGSIDYGDEAEPDNDTIVTNDDGTVTATSIDLNPDALDSYLIDGSIVDYALLDRGAVHVSVDGSSTTFAELVDEESTDDGTSGDSSTSDDSTNDDSLNTGTRVLGLHASLDNGSKIDVSFTVDGWIDYAAESEQDIDTVVANPDGTVTATSVDLNPDALDSYQIHGPVVEYTVPADAAVDVTVDGTSTTFAELVGEESTDDSGALPHRISVIGSNTKRPAEYTFTVSEEVARDPEASHVSDDGTPWDQIEDIARDGKVIGLVGSGVDAYRFDGIMTDLTVEGDAKIKVEREI